MGRDGAVNAATDTQTAEVASTLRFRALDVYRSAFMPVPRGSVTVILFARSPVWQRSAGDYTRGSPLACTASPACGSSSATQRVALDCRTDIAREVVMYGLVSIMFFVVGLSILGFAVLVAFMLMGAL